jgi:hypothetical protein
MALKIGEKIFRTAPTAEVGLAQGQAPGLDHRGHKWNAVFKITRYAPDYAGLNGKDLMPRDVIPGSGPQMPERAPEAETLRLGPGREGDRPPRQPRGEGGGPRDRAPADRPQNP